MATKLFTSDDWAQSITLQTEGAPEDVSGADGISAALVTVGDSPAVTIGPYALSAVADGADWASGVVIFEAPSVDTAGVTPGKYAIEVQVTTGGKKKTWPRLPVEVIADAVP